MDLLLETPSNHPIEIINISPLEDFDNYKPKELPNLANSLEDEQL